MPSTDVHQHLWPEGFVAELSRRSAPPRLYRSNGEWTLRIHGEPAQRFELATHDPAARAAALEVESALVCLSCPLGIESLPRDESAPLLDAFHEGVRELGAPFGLWGALALHEIDAADVDRALDAGAAGVSIPAGALVTRRGLERVAPLLHRGAVRGAPLLVHPGPAPWHPMPPTAAAAPSWWPALNGYVTQMHQAWYAWAAWGRADHPRLRIVWAMLAGGAPLHAERLAARGGPGVQDPLSYYDVSSYGPRAIDAMVRVVGIEPLVYGTDRPVIEPASLAPLGDAAVDAITSANPSRLLGRVAVAA
jgi:6-methylsalicylate decarboxylase